MKQKIIIGAVIGCTFVLTLAGCGGSVVKSGASAAPAPESSASAPQTRQAVSADEPTYTYQSVTVPPSPPAARTPAQPTDPIDVAIAEAGNYLNGRIPKGDKIAFVNAGQNLLVLAGYIIDGLIEKGVNDGVFAVVDRAQLDAIKLEQEFQSSGDVNDSTVQLLGRILGAKTIVTVVVTQMGDIYRLGVRALSIESAQIQGQFNKNIPGGKTINALAATPNPARSAVVPRSVATAPAPAYAQPAPSAVAPAPTVQIQASDINGIRVPGIDLTGKLVWLQRSAESNNTYIVEVNADESIVPQKLEYQSAVNITIVLRGGKTIQTIRLSSRGTMFIVRPNVTLILDNNIILKGYNNNNSSLVTVDGGTLIMNAGAAISDNNVSGGSSGGVYIASGIFNMNGGTISGNSTTYWWGGGVQVGQGNFTMNGGTISGNTASYGGGVQIHYNNGKGGVFTMKGGTIIGNIARELGGGVYVNGDVGGSVGGTFNMNGGTIAGNTAHKGGGGVTIHNNQRNVPSAFIKTGGTIVGYSSDPNGGNATKDNAGVIARKGHAILVIGNNNTAVWRKETTAGTEGNFSVGRTNASGAWDQ